MTAPNKTNTSAVAVILTYNEEQIIARTITNAHLYFDSVYILDSISTDKTKEIASNTGAHVLENKFDNFAAQRNFAITSLQEKFDWIFFLDADESIDEKLGESLKQAISQKPLKPIAFRMKRRNYFLGKKINYAFGSDRQFRLFGKFSELRYSGEVHEGVDLNNTDTHRLAGCIIHQDKTTISELTSKLNRYTTLEIKRRNTHSLMRMVFQLATVPVLTFLKSFIWRRGFLDGYRGFILACYSGMYKFVMISKQIEKLLQK